MENGKWSDPMASENLRDFGGGVAPPMAELNPRQATTDRLAFVLLDPAQFW
jgi:hypothetical protein